jgi:hypothetical protein
MAGRCGYTFTKLKNGNDLCGDSVAYTCYLYSKKEITTMRLLIILNDTLFVLTIFSERFSQYNE